MGEGSRKRPGLERDLSEPVPVPESAIERATAIMRSGRLFRYGEFKGDGSEVAALEREFAGYLGRRFCVAMNSCGSTLFVALKCAGVQQGDPVLTSAFTLAPVPGAIASVGAVPVFVETTQDLTIDLDDLAQKARESGARVLLLSHMRGHICDMDRLMALARAHDLQVIEDCAHTMGAAWRGVPSGRHGVIGCYSTQTYKHINSGEGGLLVTDDAEVMARAVVLSGSYMLYGKHTAAPPAEMFENVKYETPNISGRMDHLRAAILRPQLAALPQQVARWNALYRMLEAGLRNIAGLRVIERPPQESIVGSSFQFLLPDWPADRMRALLAACAARGVELKWFGAAEPVAFTSRYDSWRYAPPQRLPRTDAILAGLIDMRLPLTFSEADVRMIAEIIRDEVVGASTQAAE